MNVSDSERLSSGLKSLGLENSENENSDLVVINTCAVRQHAEERAFGQLGNLKKRRKNGEKFKVAVMGCMVSNKNKTLERKFPGLIHSLQQPYIEKHHPLHPYQLKKNQLEEEKSSVLKRALSEQATLDHASGQLVIL